MHAVVPDSRQEQLRKKKDDRIWQAPSDPESNQRGLCLLQRIRTAPDFIVGPAVSFPEIRRIGGDFVCIGKLLL